MSDTEADDKLKKAEEVARSLLDLKPIYFKSHTDLIRKPRELIRSGLEFSPEAKTAKLSGEVERINNILIKATQEFVYDAAIKQQLTERSLALSDTLFEKYRDEHIKKMVANEKRLRLASKKKSQNIEAIKREVAQTFDQNKSKVTLFRDCAIKDAWKAVLMEELGTSVDYKFYAKSILDPADIKHNDYDKIYEDIQQIQMKVQKWVEPHFDIRTGNVIQTPVAGSLFSFSRYIQRGRGSDNEIALTMNKDMLHMVFFLSRGYITTRGAYNNLIRTGNGIVLYNILSDVASVLTPYVFVFEEIQSRFGTKYTRFQSFAANVIQKSLDRVNRELGLTISFVKRKVDSKTINGIEFIMSDHDRMFLRTHKNTDNIQLEGNVPIGQTFGYFLALRQHFKKKNISNIESYALTLNEKLKNMEYVFTEESQKDLLTKHKRHLDAIGQIMVLLQEYSEHLGNLYFDEVYHVVRKHNEQSESGDDMRLGDDAQESLAVLHLKYIDNIEESHPPLPGMENVPDKIDAYFPFVFKVGQKHVEIDTSNYQRHSVNIQKALKRSMLDFFTFSDPVVNMRFRKQYGEKSVVAEAEVLRERTTPLPESEEDKRAEHYGVFMTPAGDMNIDDYDGSTITTHDGVSGKIIKLGMEHGAHIITVYCDDEKVCKLELPFTEYDNVKRYLHKYVKGSDVKAEKHPPLY
ncbi:MAG: hypothetical protein U9Q62_07945 [Campylobacterota bacterium]|nr:hypothetical protein [Campylobacterota bacterium]